MTLSPAKHYQQMPTGLVANLTYRRQLMEECRKSETWRRTVRRWCQEDILFYINSFVWQFNPTKKKPGEQKIGPFNAWDFQKEALLGRRGILWCYENDKTCVVEKSREMGASWLFLIFQDWLCLFHDHTQCLNISKSADAVDCKSPDSLFWKLRFMHERLPEWLRGDIVEEKMFLHYKRTQSYNSGEASTGRAGVGGRAAVIFVDEFSKIKEDVEVRQRTASTANCRFFNGTHEGTATEFFRLTQSPEIVKIVMHWTQHPEKNKGLYHYDEAKGQVEPHDRTYAFQPGYQFVRDGKPTGGPYPGIRSPWYDGKCTDIGSSRGVAMELDIDPQGAVSQFFEPIVIQQLIVQHAKPPLWEGELEYDQDTGRPEKLIQQEGGRLKLWVQPTPEGKMPLGKYGLGTDVATGSGATNSCLSGGNAATGEKVLEYASPTIKPEKFAVLSVAISWLLKDQAGSGALLAWECPGPGLVFGQKVVELGYRNVYYRTNEFSFVARAAAEVPGWYAAPENKRALLEHYKAALLSREFINHSEEAMRECLNFRYTASGNVEHTGEQSRDDPSGARVNHGDRCIADALCHKMLEEIGRPNLLQPKKEEIPHGSLAWRRQLREDAHKQEEAWS